MELILDKMRKAWCRDTAHHSYYNKWCADNPSIGQCTISALIVNELFGYKIFSCRIGRFSHYFNVEPDGNIFDTTREQFKEDIKYNQIKEVKREALLKNKDTLSRFLLLKERMNLKEF